MTTFPAATRSTPGSGACPAGHHAAGDAEIAKELAAPLGPVQKVADASAKLGRARAALGGAGLLVRPRPREGRARGIEPAWGGAANVTILTPGTRSLAGPVKPGDGNKSQKAANGARDLNERRNVRRV